MKIFLNGECSDAPAFEANAEQRAEVRRLASLGMAENDIAGWLGISKKDLQQYFAHELRVGTIRTNEEILHSLFAIARQNKSSAAAAFLAKSRVLAEQGRPAKTKSDSKALPETDLYDGIEVYINDGSPNGEF